MNKDSVIDYSSCILFKGLGAFLRHLPIGFNLFWGRRLGDFLYCFDLKHKAIVYSNIKRALGSRLTPAQVRRLTYEFYQSFGQNLIELFFIPLVDKEYIHKYISFQGLDFIEEAFKEGKGVILLAVHAGSWELSNVICADLGFKFNLLVRDQRYPRLNEWLNKNRIQRGCKIIQRKNQTRYLVEALKNNESVGMTIDQGGKTGAIVKFFGKAASMATGAVRLALKYNSVVLPSYYTRVKGPYIKTIIRPPFKVKKTGDSEKDIRDNVQELIRIFEKDIEKYAKDYLWSYRIWKYTTEKNILILSDEKAGHLRQSQAAANIVSRSLQDKGVVSKIDTVEIKFKNSYAKKALMFSSGFSGKYQCQGCLWCLRAFLQKENYQTLMSITPDIIISCGSSVACVNYILSRENNAKSLVIMRPSFFSTRRFDLVIMPRHDHPPKRKNVLATEGALNLVDKEYLGDHSQKLIKSSGSKLYLQSLYIGLLIGGDAKGFHLTKQVLWEVIQQAKLASEKLGAGILATTSRRTSKELEELIKKELGNDPRCKLLVIANENNIPEAIGGILGLSQFVIASAESIAMISEAISSQKYVLVFNPSQKSPEAYSPQDERPIAFSAQEEASDFSPRSFTSPGLSRKHREFLSRCVKNKYIYLTERSDLSKTIEGIWKERPPIRTWSDNFLIREAVGKIL